MAGWAASSPVALSNTHCEQLASRNCREPYAASTGAGEAGRKGLLLRKPRRRSNIWSLISSTLPTSKRGGVQTVHRPWAEEELQKLFTETDAGDPIWSVAALSLYGGFRIEEVCQLKVADFKDGALRVRVTKSDAGVRAVPVHPVIAPMVKQLAKTSTDGYLLPGLLIAGRDAKRSVYLSKRAAYHLREVLGFGDKAHVVHGLRHTFTSACERAGIPLSTAQLLVGHSRRGSITYGAPGAS
jgi:integrase